MEARVAPDSGTRPEGPVYTGGARWLQLGIGVVCMAMIANLQYGWTLFVNPIAEKYRFDKHSLQYAFTIFVLFETWLVPFKGYAADKLGPRFLVVIFAQQYGWQGAFYAAAWLNIAAALLAIAVLRPLRRRYVTRYR